MYRRMQSLFVVALTAAPFAGGCGGDANAKRRPTGTLKGAITVNGAPVPAKTALVLQHVESGKLHFALADESGAYKVEQPDANLPVGRYDVSVTPAQGIGEGQEAAEDALGDTPSDRKKLSTVDIPKKYLNAHESGLSFELQEGANEKKFDLKK